MHADVRNIDGTSHFVGRVECAPCSRIYITFYKKSGNGMHPHHHYSRNKLRTAELWMDDAGALVKVGLGKVPADAAGDLEPRKALRKRLGCKSFAWYLQNVYPENEIVDPIQDVLALGVLKVRGSTGKKCVDSLGKLNFGDKIGSYGCNGGSNQNFVLLRNKHIMPLSKMEICLNTQLKWARCGTIAGKKQREEHMSWTYDSISGRVQELENMKCLSMAVEGGGGGVSLEPCCSEVAACPDQQWDWPKYTDTVRQLA